MNLIFNIFGFLLLVVSVFVFGLKGMPTEMGIAVAASFVFLAFANLDKFSKFKGAGFEAELKTTIDKANATIEQLKSVAVPFAITSLQSLAKGQRWAGGYPMFEGTDQDAFSNTHELFDGICDLIDKNELHDKRLDVLRTQYINIYAWDMFEKLARNIEKNGKPKFFDEISEVIGKRNYNTHPNLSKFKQLLVDAELNNEFIQQLNAIESYYERYKL